MEKEVKIYEDATWGNIGKDIVPSRFYQVYRNNGLYQGGDDEGTWYNFESEDVSNITVTPTYPNYEWNKYGETKLGEEVSVTITPNSTLKGKYPDALVKIDGKFYDLKYLDNPVKLLMDKDYRISILWATDLVETFRIVCLK